MCMGIRGKSDIDGGIYVFEKRHTSLCVLSWLRIWRQLIQSSTIGWAHIVLLNDGFQCSLRLLALFRLSFSFHFYVAVKYWRYSLLICFEILGFGGLLLHRNGCSGWCLTNRCCFLGVSKQYHTRKKVYCTQPQMNSPAEGKQKCTAKACWQRKTDDECSNEWKKPAEWSERKKRWKSQNPYFSFCGAYKH